MRLTSNELALLDAETAAGRMAPPHVAPPGLGATPTLAALTQYRRARLALSGGEPR